MRKAKIINMEHLKKIDEDINLDNTGIGIVNSEKYLQLVQDMSEFIDTLNMPFLEKRKIN